MTLPSKEHRDSRDSPAAVAVGFTQRAVWRLCTTGILLTVFCGQPQPILGAEPLVELVLADSEHQARVVGRAMRTGFFIDQLLIPETSYVGRIPWSELAEGVKGALEEAQPGEPYLLTGAKGKYLVARVMTTGPPAVLGETEFAEDREAIWAVLSVGPTDPRLLSQEVDIDTEDLAAVCQSKRRYWNNELRDARAKVAALSPGTPLQEVIEAHGDVASMLSLQGEMAEAIQQVESFAPLLPTESPTGQLSYRDVMHQVLGILELRRGEVDNCLQAHNREMCLFPLSEAARHRIGDGALKAVDHFSRYLERHPGDLEVRWLLNVAAMTAGTYPAGVPEPLRIGPDSFASAVDLGRFWDVAGPAGVAYSDNAGGIATDDFDGDGLLDLMVSSEDNCEPLRFFRNRGDGTFAQIIEAAGLENQLGGLNITQIDYDNDGRRDLFVMRGGWETAIRDSLLRNKPAPDGGVVFEDVTVRAGLGGPGHRTHTATWADYDGDGWLDLFLGHEFSFSQLFRNQGDGTFEDVTLQAGLRLPFLHQGCDVG